MEVINWKNVYEQSSTFKNNKPTKWAFIEDFVNIDLYNELYETYPKFDDTWQKDEGLASKEEGVKLSYRKLLK